MKKIIYIIMFAVVASFTACDNYIDITPKGAVTVDSAYTYYELVLMPNRTYWPTCYALLTDEQYCKESKIMGNENTTLDGINYTFNENADRTQLAQNNLYENAYKYILRYNIVIDNIMNSVGDERIKQLGMAEARLLRAWEHFVVVNTYAKAYNPATAANDGGIAIMDKYDLEATPSKSSVEEVYTFIKNDIDAALPYLQETPDIAGHPSLAYGYGLKALVCLFHHDWKEAEEAADESLRLNGELVDYTTISKVTSNTNYRYTGGKSGNPEVLDPTTSSVGFTGTLMYNYGQISKELTDLFDQKNDQRYALFFQNNNGAGAYAYYFDAGVGASCWLSGATLNRFYYSTVGLRTAEVYLIKAECQARQGDINGAMSTVSKIREKRIKGFDVTTVSASNTKEAMEQIITERRKELLFGFHRFWDLKRLNTEPEYAKTVTHVYPQLTEGMQPQTYTLRPDSRLYIIPFPRSARERNPNLTLNTDD